MSWKPSKTRSNVFVPNLDFGLTVVSKESAALQRSYTGVRKWRQVLSALQGREGAEAVLKDWGMAWHGMVWHAERQNLDWKCLCQIRILMPPWFDRFRPRFKGALLASGIEERVWFLSRLSLA